MKFSLSILLLPFLAALSLAQNIDIGAPTAGTSVTPGSNITVEVDRPNFLSGAEEVAIVIAINPCGSAPCNPPSEVLGRILYNGPFNPQYSTNPTNGLPPHQDFSVQIPSNLASGNALLSVTHLSLVGAGPFPLFEIVNVTVNVV